MKKYTLSFRIFNESQFLIALKTHSFRFRKFIIWYISVWNNLIRGLSSNSCSNIALSLRPLPWLAWTNVNRNKQVKIALIYWRHPPTTLLQVGGTLHHKDIEKKKNYYKICKYVQIFHNVCSWPRESGLKRANSRQGLIYRFLYTQNLKK